jgi:muramidase (phage lysozyme)
MARTQEDLTRLVVSLEARMDQYNKAMARAEGVTNKSASAIERRFQKTEQALKGFGKNFFSGLNVGAILGTVTAAGIADFAKQAVRHLAEIKVSAEKAGVSIADFQKLTFAGIGTGTEASGIVAIMEDFNKKLGEAATKGGDLKKLFDANGIAIRNSNGAVRDNVELLAQAADLVKNAGSAEEAQLITVMALGRGGADAVAFLKQGGDEIRKSMGAAEGAGAVIRTNLVLAADEFAVRWAKSIAGWKDQAIGAAAEIALQFEAAFTHVNDMMLVQLRNRADELRKSIAFLQSSPIDNFFAVGVGSQENMKRQLGEVEARIRSLGGTPSQENAALAAPSVTKQIADVNAQRAMLAAQIAAMRESGNDNNLAVTQAQLDDLNAEVVVLEGRLKMLTGGVDRHAAAAHPMATVVPVQPADDEKAAEKSAIKTAHDLAEEKLKLAEATEVLFTATRREISAMLAEAALRGKSIYDIQRQKKQQDLLNQLEDEHRQHGGAVTPQEISTVNALAAAYGRVAQAIADNAREIAALKGVTDTAFQGMENAIDSFIDTGKFSFKEMVASILKDEAKLAVHNLLDTVENGTPGTGNTGLMGLLTKLLPALPSLPAAAVTPVPVSGDRHAAVAATVAPVASADLVASGSAASRAFFDLVGKAEGTDKGRGYNETLGYGAYTGGPRNLTSMSLDQIRELQDKMLANPANTFNSSAVGRYQITGQTLDSLKQQLGLKGNELFDPAMQDRLATTLMQQRGPDTGGLRNEWQGLNNVASPDILAAYQEQIASSGKTLATSLTQVSKTAATSADGFATSFGPALAQIIGAIGGPNAGAAAGAASGILPQLLGLIFGGGGASLYAGGGSIDGPGTGTSDSIVARVSKGEFIVNADSTKRHRGLLEAINNGHPFPRFADGGSVDGPGNTGLAALAPLRMPTMPQLTGMGSSRQHMAVSVSIDASPLLLATTDARASRIARTGDAGTLRTANRQGPSRIAKFNQLGT